MEDPGIDPGASRMLSGRSTIWARPPELQAYTFWYLLTFSVNLNWKFIASLKTGTAPTTKNIS